MSTNKNCPEHEELRQLLEGSLSSERLKQCTAHMDSCACCQSKLEDIATEGTGLSQVVEHLDAVVPASGSAYWPALKSLDNVYRETFVPRSTPKRGTPSLDFLQPPTDPAYLGRLAQFDVMRIIGRGGMGIVLEAFDSRLQRHVAIKVLDPELADDEVSRQRFCREARAAASITHENVVAVHQVERDGGDGLPYLVMQLVSGETLEERLLRTGKMPVREIVRIGMQASQGLAAAHAQGLIHRDIKPGNILLEPPNDRVKLTDFGLARVVDDVKLTRTGFVTGTPMYMAPEQANGDEADPRSDVFSLGAILYEMSVGQPPFKGNSALAILKQIAEAKPQPIRELNPAIPQWLAETIHQLLEKKPENRIQTAALLAELFEYEWALMKTTSDEIPTVCQEELRALHTRHRRITMGIGAAFLLMGLLGGIFFASRPTKTEVVTVPVPAQPVASSAEPAAVLTSNAGTVWSVAFNPASDTVAMAVEDGSVRLWDWAAQSVKSTIPAHRGVVWSAQFFPSGERLVTAGDDGFIKVWKLSETEPVQTFENANAVRGLALSHDESTLFAGVRDGRVRIWSLEKSDQPVAEMQQTGAVYAIVLSPDGETLASAGTDKTVHLWNAKTLTQKLPLEGHTGPVYGLAFNHDGKRLASVGWDKSIHIWDTGNGQSVQSWEGHNGDIWGVAFSPDGTLLATGGHDGAVKVWDASTGTLRDTYLGHKIAVHTVAFNQDGTLLASGGRDGAARVWKIR